MGAYYQPHYMYGMGAETLPPQPGDPNFMGPLQPADQAKLAANLVKAGIKYPAPPSTMFSSKNLMIFAVVGIAAYFLFFKK
jgi:hypothetical protein